MPPNLVIFDCDGVLVDSEPIVNDVESEFFATLGVTIDPREARRRFQGKTVTDVAGAVAAALGRPLSAEALYTWGMTTALGLVTSLQAVPGIRDVVEWLVRTGTPVCVASQSPLPRVRLSLAVTDLSRYFADDVFTASMVARPKPAPDLFLHAAATMGIPASCCIVVEDSPTGILAADAAGMTALGYAAPDGLGEDALRAAGARVFTTMSELPALLAAAIST